MIPFRDANPSDRVPIVTVALIVVNALAGAHLVLFPHARVQTLVPFFFYLKPSQNKKTRI